MVKILLADDEPRMRRLVSDFLRREGYALVEAEDGQQALDLFFSEKGIGLVILDVMMPLLDGIEVLRRLRAQDCRIPVLLLTAKSQIGDRVEGLDAGADDYLIKPFAFGELLARVNALARRPAMAASQTVLKVADLEMDLLARKVQRAGREIDLQPREFGLLEYLMRNAGRIVSKTMIMEHVWDYHFDPQTNVVDVLVFRLRSKLERKADRKILHTIRGVGYVLREE